MKDKEGGKMKSMIVEKEEIRVDRYPRLMKLCPYNNMVVLFSGDKQGIVVHSPASNDREIGYQSSTWDMTQFETFNKAVLLQN